jgi:hypothetical protein
MNWKDTLRELEKNKQWDEAIEFMQQIVQEHVYDQDAYLCMNYLLVQAIFEEYYKREQDKYRYYCKLAVWYFNQSYEKFSDDPEYLYFTGKAAAIDSGYFNIREKEAEAMIDKAQRLDPENLTYKDSYYWDLSLTSFNNPELVSYARILLAGDSPVEKQLKDKGALGEYLWKIKKEWCAGILRNLESNLSSVDWKETLQSLERQKRWDESIQFMQYVIENNQDDKDAYIFMNYLLMNLLGEEMYDRSQFDYYAKLTKWYFNKSFAKYSEDAEFLYITGKTAVMGEWHFGIDRKDYEAMLDKAIRLDPENLVYNEYYYWDLSKENPKHSDFVAYLRAVLDENSAIAKQLNNKGAVGEYLLGMKRYGAERALSKASQ